MCIVFVSAGGHMKFIILNNRDEFFDRPTADAAYWPDHPNILGGRDTLRGGAWFAITKEGKFATITNFRQPVAELRSDARSRGEVSLNYLTGNSEAGTYLEEIISRHTEYDGFNTIVGDLVKGELIFYSNKDPTIAVQQVPGKNISALSNALLNTPWPKVSYGLARLKMLEEQLAASPMPEEELIERLFDLLSYSEEAPDDQLPNTGVPYELEKRLSSVFVAPMSNAGHSYGTRTSTILLVDYENNAHLIEKTLIPATGQWKRSEYRLKLGEHASSSQP